MEIILKPIQKLTIQEIVQEDIENYLHHCYCSNRISATWVDGMILFYQQLRGDSDLEYLIKGEIFIEKIVFVKYPKYTKSKKWNGGNYELMIKNLSKHPDLKELARWVKQQPIWNEAV